MTHESPGVRLVWITKAYAVNPAHIVLVFHGNHGEVQITFVGNQVHSLYEHDLTVEGRALLLPQTGASPGEAIDRLVASRR
jgi:hypothetical protein